MVPLLGEHYFITIMNLISVTWWSPGDAWSGSGSSEQTEQTHTGRDTQVGDGDNDLQNNSKHLILFSLHL